MDPRHMVEWLLDALAGFGVVEHHLACVDSVESVSLPEDARAMPVLRCAHAIALLQFPGISGAEARHKESMEVVGRISSQ